MKVYDTQKIYDLLSLLKLRTDMWLGEKSVSRLEVFISGYMIFGKWGIYDLDIYVEGDPDFNEFLYWIQDIPFIKVSSGPFFSKFLLEKTNGNEEEAFDLFYKLLDEFKTLKVNQCL